jgi:hypothetical protein
VSSDLTTRAALPPVHLTAEGTRFVVSIALAMCLGMRHDNLLQMIDRLIDGLRSQEMIDAFRRGEFIDVGGRPHRAFSLSEGAVSLIAMSVRGKGSRGLREQLALLIEQLRSGNAPSQLPVAAHPVASQLPVPNGRTGAGDLARLMEAVMSMTARWSHLSPESLQLHEQTILAPYAPGLAALPGPVIAEPCVGTTELAERYGISPSTFGKLIKHLKTPENGEHRLAPASNGNGKQIPIWVWNRRGVAAVEAFMAENGKTRLH